MGRSPSDPLYDAHRQRRARHRARIEADAGERAEKMLIELFAAVADDRGNQATLAAEVCGVARR
jgi:hypothetical protein